jgi:nucleoside phosphorylase
MIVVAFPTEFEARGFLKKLQKVSSHSRVPDVTFYSGYIGNKQVAVVITGMGPEQSQSRMRTFLGYVETKVLILAGFAGALTDSVYRGQILVAQDYSNAELINYIRLIPGFDIARVHTVSEPVTTGAEKRALGLQTGCQMVDMETAYLSDLAAQMDVEFMAVRAISDLVNEDLPQDVLDHGYDLEASKTTPARMALYLITNPRRIKALKEFVKPLPEVRDRLGDFVYTVVEDL